MQVPWPEPPTLWHLVAAAPASERETRQGLRLERRGRGAHSLVAEGTRGQPGATRSPERGHRERVTLAEARARGRLGAGARNAATAKREHTRARRRQGRAAGPVFRDGKAGGAHFSLVERRWEDRRVSRESCAPHATPPPDASLLRAPRSPVTSCCFVTPRGDGL